MAELFPRLAPKNVVLIGFAIDTEVIKPVAVVIVGSVLQHWITGQVNKKLFVDPLLTILQRSLHKPIADATLPVFIFNFNLIFNDFTRGICLIASEKSASLRHK